MKYLNIRNIATVICATGCLYLSYPNIKEFYSSDFFGLSGTSSARLLPDVSSVILQKGMQTLGSQISGTIEKATGAGKEMQQSNLNWVATKETSNASSRAQDTFSDPDALDGMCSVAEDQSSLMDAKISSDLWAKSLTATNLNRNMQAGNPGMLVKRNLDEHNSKYCSDEDSIRGRCIASGAGMANADIESTTIFNPNLGMTYSDAEYSAAIAASKNIVNAVPLDNLPVAFEGSSEGKSYIIRKRSNEATLSLSDFAMAQMIARRKSRDVSQ